MVTSAPHIFAARRLQYKNYKYDPGHASGKTRETVTSRPGREARSSNDHDDEENILFLIQKRLLLGVYFLLLLKKELPQAKKQGPNNCLNTDSGSNLTVHFEYFSTS
jgi:hypothetical protein